MTKRPDWISKNEDGKDSVRCAEPELTAQLARYACMTGYRFQSESEFPIRNSNGAVENRAMLVATGTHIRDARTLSDWVSFSEAYPEKAMDPSEFGEHDNPNADVRAFCLQQAVTRLLEIVDAPATMAADLKTLLDRYVPKGAESRGRVQRAILEDPGASLQQIAVRAEASAGQISKDGKAGLLFWPADTVGAGPSSSK